MPDASSAAALPLSGPCAGARNEVDSRCAEADRLAQAAVAQRERVRELRRALMEVSAQREVDARVRDRRQLAADKDAARDAYRAAMRRARDQSDVQAAAGTWLREIDQLNRRLRVADARADAVAQRSAELERVVPGAELAADAARIAAEAAQEACLGARRTLAECEEAAARGDAGRTAGHRRRGPSTMSLVLDADLPALTRITAHMAEETGVEAGRLQLLMIDLREQVAARALADLAFQHPADNPFWCEFSATDARLVAQNLAAMGYRFDGRAGWADGRVPTMRELAVAVSNVGFDPRGNMRPGNQDAIDRLWDGTKVLVDEYLAAAAPDLDLQDLMACLGSDGARLSELWDMWGRLRPLLLNAAWRVDAA